MKKNIECLVVLWLTHGHPVEPYNGLLKDSQQKTFRRIVQKRQRFSRSSDLLKNPVPWGTPGLRKQANDAAIYLLSIFNLWKFFSLDIGGLNIFCQIFFFAKNRVEIVLTEVMCQRIGRKNHSQRFNGRREEFFEKSSLGALYSGSQAPLILPYSTNAPTSTINKSLPF